MQKVTARLTSSVLVSLLAAGFLVLAQLFAAGAQESDKTESSQGALSPGRILTAAQTPGRTIAAPIVPGGIRAHTGASRPQTTPQAGTVGAPTSSGNPAGLYAVNAPAVPGDNGSDLFVMSSIPYSHTGTTVGFADDYDQSCGRGHRPPPTSSTVTRWEESTTRSTSYSATPPTTPS